MKVYVVVARWENPSDCERQCSIEGVCSNETKAESLRKKRLKRLSWTDTIEIEIEEFEVDGFESEGKPLCVSLMREINKVMKNED